MLFEVKALAPSGQVVVLRIDAAAEADARREAQTRGMSVFSARAANAPRGRLASRGRSRLNVLSFCQELLMLLRAGLSLMAALEGMAEKEYDSGARLVIESVLLKLRQGGRLSEALTESGGGFPQLLIAGVSASERTGSLEETLERYCDYASRIDAARKKIVAAMIYPTMLLGVGFLVSAFLIGFVVPKFAGVYREAGGDMPWASALLFDIGRVIGAYPLQFVAGALLLVMALVTAFSAQSTRDWFVLRLRALPVVGQHIRVYELARLYRTLAMLLRGGTPVVPALGLAASMLSGAMRKELALASRQIAQGQPISQALQKNGLTTPVGNRMLAVGERSGSMADMLGRIADYHDEETSRWVDWAARMLEPVLMALLGIVIGGIVILLYMPIFDLAGSVK